MVTGHNRVFGCAANLLRGKKCVFCGSFKVNRTRRGYVKCRKCSKQKSLAKLRREIAILQGFYQQVPAYRLAHDLAVDAKVISRVYQRLRAAIFHVAELEAMESKLSGEIELDERGGSGWLDSFRPFISGAWPMIPTRRCAARAGYPHTLHSVCARQAPEAA